MRNLLISFPRSGSTWLRLFLEWCTGHSTRSIYESKNWDRPVLYEADPPILYRAHRMIDANVNKWDRIVFLYRNPFDVIVSNIKYHGKELTDGNVKWEVDRFVNFINDMISCPNENIQVRYEDMLKDFKKEANHVIDFLDLEISDEKIDRFLARDEQNFIRYLEYFARVNKHLNVTYDKKFMTRRNALTDEQINIIKSALTGINTGFPEKERWLE